MTAKQRETIEGLMMGAGVPPKRENKQLICNALAKALKLTRQYSDLKKIIVEKREYGTVARVVFPQDIKTVDITADSGAALIRDIVKGIR